MKTKDKVFAIIGLVFGIMLLFSGTEWYHYLLAFVGIGSGSYTFYKNREKKNSSLDILKERYAKGEITKEEFDKMKSDLT